MASVDVEEAPAPVEQVQVEEHLPTHAVFASFSVLYVRYSTSSALCSPIYKTARLTECGSNRPEVVTISDNYCTLVIGYCDYLGTSHKDIIVTLTVETYAGAHAPCTKLGEGPSI